MPTTSATRSIPAWFILPLVWMVVFQLIRLGQTSPAIWLLCDYAQRLGALILLAAFPAARAIAFQRQPLRTNWWETLLWIIALALFLNVAGPWVVYAINSCVPDTRLGNYPQPDGFLHVFDLLFGVALVALHEEIYFRRCARHVFGKFCGDGWVMILATSAFFAAYHWWVGLGSIANVFLFGILAMVMLRRTGALWPLILGHYLGDLLSLA